MMNIFYNKDDGYFYIKEGNYTYNIQFVSVKEAEEWIYEMFNNY